MVDRGESILLRIWEGIKELDHLVLGWECPTCFGLLTEWPDRDVMRYRCEACDKEV